MAKRRNDTRPPATSATPATRAADEWGLPDWRDPEAYGDVKRWTFNRWRWEFYRRRDDLRAYFDAHADESWRRGSVRRTVEGDPLRPDEPGFKTLHSPEALERFGYASVPNPRIGDQPEINLETSKHPGVKGIKGTGHALLKSQPLGSFLKLSPGYESKDWASRAINFAGIDLDLYEFDYEKIQAGDDEEAMRAERDGVLACLSKCHAIPLKDNQLIITFDLDEPLESQLEDAAYYLRWLQHDHHGKLLQKKRHPKKWLGYLRTLDAREDGASWREIAAIHPNTARTEQTARDIWEAADALRFNF
jgi:hypothetical protein